MLDTVEGVVPGRATLRPSASLRIAGEQVARHQIELAAAAGAARVLVLGDKADDRVEAMLGAGRAAGLPAKIVRDAPELCAEVTAADELLVIADSLMVDPATALAQLGGQGIATLPVEKGIAAGFERIDADHAWAGIMLVPGSHAERLRELPRDVDTASALLRIALMTRLNIRRVDPAALSDGRWVLVRTDETAQAVETARLERSIRKASGVTPGPRIAGFAARRFGGRLLESDHGDLLVGTMAVLLAGAALAATGFQQGWLAFVFMGLCWMALRGQRVLQAVRRQGRLRRRGRDLGQVLLLAYDVLLVAIIAVNGGPGFAQPSQWFAALMLVAMLRLGAQQYPYHPIRPWLEDRPLLCAGLALSAFWAWPVTLSMLLAGVLALTWIGFTFQSGTGATKLTRP